MRGGDWEDVRPGEVAEVLAGLRAPWWIAGGWALDLFLGRVTRAHGDLDVVVLRGDQRAAFAHLSGWDLRYATPEHRLVPWDGRFLTPPLFGVWARRGPGPWTFELLLDDAREGRWVYRRDPSVTWPLASLGGRRAGIPYLRPELVLLLKAKAPSALDTADLCAVAPRLSSPGREWLAAALRRTDPRHPWLGRLAPGHPGA